MAFKQLLILSTFLLPFMAVSQNDLVDHRGLVFDSIDLKIVERAVTILSDSSEWHKEDDRECDDDIANERFSLFCALYKASLDITGEYVHRRAAMQMTRYTLEKYREERIVSHRLMDWNNHPDTTFEEVKTILQQAVQAIKKQLK